MQLKREYEKKIRENLRLFGRWAYCNEKQKASPLARLFESLKYGKSAESLAKEIQNLAVDEKMRREALKLLENMQSPERIEDKFAARIDMAVSFIIGRESSMDAVFLRRFFNLLYVERGRKVMLTNVIAQIRNEEGLPHVRDAESNKTLYRYARRLRATLEAEIFYALAHLEKMKSGTTTGELLNSLNIFNRTFYDAQIMDVRYLEVYNSSRDKSELIFLLRKIM